MRTKERGITLIALVVTIIVLLILAGISIQMLTGRTGIIGKAKEASVKSKFSAYKEETDMHMNETLVCAGEKLKEYLSISDADLQKFMILKGKLYFLGKDESEIEMAESVGIDTTFSKTNITVEDIINIVENILPKQNELGESENIDDLPGIKLYSKNLINRDNWNIVVDYDENMLETSRYGDGYYLLKAGTYEIDGKRFDLKSDYIIDYSSYLFIALSNDYVNWNLNSILTSKDKLFLNLNGADFGDYLTGTNSLDNEKLKKEAGVEVNGDILFNSTDRTLEFNRNYLTNPMGEGGFLKLDGSYCDFSNGFTFDFYGTFDRMSYKPETANRFGAGLFYRSNRNKDDYLNALKCSCGNDKDLDGLGFLSIRFGKGEGNFEGEGMYSKNNVTNCTLEGIIEKNKETYFTISVMPFNDVSDLDAEYYEKIKDRWSGRGCLVTCFANGTMIGWTVAKSDALDNGLQSWNKDMGDLNIGFTQWADSVSLGFSRFYFKGEIKTLRIWGRGMNDGEIENNYKLTLKFFESF